MINRRYFLGFSAFVGMLVLIFDGKTAVQAAFDGITLCLKTVIPSLFPFFVLSNLITVAYTGTEIKILSPISRLCKLQDGLESVIIPAYLGGYPTGAQTIAQGWRAGQIEKKEAERMLGFCNNAGPSFLFGMAGVMFPQRWMPWMLWIIHILSSVIAANLIPQTCMKSGKISQFPVSFPNAVYNAISAMASVCGWIVFFRVMIGFLDRWILWLLPKPWKVILFGAMELSIGCMQLQDIADVGLRFIACSGMLAFGGLCVMMQVASATQGLSLKWFFMGKCIQTAVSFIFSWVFVSGDSIVFGFLTLLLPLIFIKTRKKDSIPEKASV